MPFRPCPPFSTTQPTTNPTNPTEATNTAQPLCDHLFAHLCSVLLLRGPTRVSLHGMEACTRHMNLLSFFSSLLSPRGRPMGVTVGSARGPPGTQRSNSRCAHGRGFREEPTMDTVTGRAAATHDTNWFVSLSLPFCPPSTPLWPTLATALLPCHPPRSTVHRHTAGPRGRGLPGGAGVGQRRVVRACLSVWNCDAALRFPSH